MAGKFFQQPIIRNEDPRLLTGKAKFIDDISLPGMLHAAFLRSDYCIRPDQKYRRLGRQETPRRGGCLYGCRFR